jgi:hypothetical protein
LSKEQRLEQRNAGLAAEIAARAAELAGPLLLSN